jgi:hypothetical protein
MTEEDEAFNDIERMSKIRRESVRSSMLKPKTAEEFYSELRERALEEIRGKYEERTAMLVSAEREACAKVADGWPDYDVEGLAKAIRARGQA